MGFPVIITKKKNRSLNFSENYQVLSKIMIADKSPLPEIEEVIDHRSGLTMFSKLDQFFGYWHFL